MCLLKTPAKTMLQNDQTFKEQITPLLYKLFLENIKEKASNLCS